MPPSLPQWKISNRQTRGCYHLFRIIPSPDEAPLQQVQAACLMLDHVGQGETATRIRSAIDEVVQAGESRTADMGGTANTKEFTAALVKALR